MVFVLDDDKVGFPDPRLAEADGLLAVGGGMTPEWLLNAYYMGIFPWYEYNGAPYWYSPEKRMVLKPNGFNCSKSLRRVIKSGRFEVRIDTCFEEVMRKCAETKREGQNEGSWITDFFIDSYCELYRQGFAHSFETFMDGRLVGGLYGIGLSDYFCGESMFHTVRDASKVAFARMVEFAQLHGMRFVDAQLYTDHLFSLGAREIERDEYLDMLKQQDINKTYRGRWKNNSVVLLIGGNQGDRVAILMRAVAEISHRIGTVSLLSALYETEPWGFEAEQQFLNQAVVVDTDMTPIEVLEEALRIEKDLGRVRLADGGAKADASEGLASVGEAPAMHTYSSRPIDIDVIFFNSEMVDMADLQLPHPRMHLRRFVLAPLAEIIPDFQHPKFHKSIRQMLEECEDSGVVKKYF